VSFQLTDTYPSLEKHTSLLQNPLITNSNCFIVQASVFLGVVQVDAKQQIQTLILPIIQSGH
jgi:hypothetical protein